MGPRRRLAYRIINGSSAPVWLAMIIAPRARVTRWLVARAPWLHIGLGVAYDGLLSAGMFAERRPLDVTDPDALRRALTQPDTFLAAWSHYITFDLFVGAWIWEDARREGHPARLALVLTWLAGPAGLSLYLVQKRRRR